MINIFNKGEIREKKRRKQRIKERNGIRKR